jgi:DNA processing protein
MVTKEVTMDIRDFLLYVHLASGASPSVARSVLTLLAAGQDVGPATLLMAVSGHQRAQLTAITADTNFQNRFATLVTQDFLTYVDDDYPERLRMLDQPPLVLFTRGKLELLRQPCLAVVGARRAGEYSRQSLARLIPELPAVTCIVSGLAKGADSCAHRAALACGRAPIGVIATGLDVKYPHRQDNLQEQVAENGLLVSEYPPGTRALPFRFIARNRIIAGLAHGLLVTEAAHHSGSLITATMALDAGRTVFALPNRIDAPLGVGTNEILQNGAALVQSAADISAELHYFA